MMLTVENLHKSYQVGQTTYEVLKGISLEVEKGEFVAVMGPSGSGKTTLLNCISCYIPADCGEIILGDRPLAALDETALAAVRNKQLGFVFRISSCWMGSRCGRISCCLPLLEGVRVPRQRPGQTDSARYLASPPSRKSTRQRSPVGRSSARQWPGR